MPGDRGRRLCDEDGCLHRASRTKAEGDAPLAWIAELAPARAQPGDDLELEHGERSARTGSTVNVPKRSSPSSGSFSGRSLRCATHVRERSSGVALPAKACAPLVRARCQAFTADPLLEPGSSTRRSPSGSAAARSPRGQRAPHQGEQGHAQERCGDHDQRTRRSETAHDHRDSRRDRDRARGQRVSPDPWPPARHYRLPLPRRPGVPRVARRCDPPRRARRPSGEPLAEVRLPCSPSSGRRACRPASGAFSTTAALVASAPGSRPSAAGGRAPSTP
jgi:hypothetical protein